ncbi:hemolysin family protein [Pseudalkalibacillus hwajinpoensis]|uniref:hemolysin family protein n=1 Tax=Guptibacillus hwajinpoensis TaxID=208199 RepID=UPI00325B9AA8
MEIIKIIVVILLIVLTAFFVASEFAIVKIRRTRIDALAREGNKKAKSVQKVLGNLDGYLSACQLGITITALALGWLGEETVEHLLHPLFELINLPETIASTVTIALAFAIITFLHVVLGELAPKTFAIQKAESVSLLLAGPLIWFYRIMYPFIWALNGSARGVVRLFGLKSANEHEQAHSEEELRLILSESYKSGEINKSEMEFVNNIFEFDDRMAREIMIPRTEMTCLFLNNTTEENLEIMKTGKYTRYPVADGDKDKIVGVVNIKEILTQYRWGEELILKEYIHPINHVIETEAIKTLLAKMQKSHNHIAIVVDEYGGTAGLVTVEDILEEIVGEIQDEFDIDEKLPISKDGNGNTIVDGKALISDINDLLGTSIDRTDVDTIGGWILTNDIEPKQGTTFSVDGYEFTVRDVDGHQIKELEIKQATD